MADAGIGGSMAAAASQRQAWTAALARQGVFGPSADGWRVRADEILATVAPSNPKK
jgi:hypothetical protein